YCLCPLTSPYVFPSCYFRSFLCIVPPPSLTCTLSLHDALPFSTSAAARPSCASTPAASPWATMWTSTPSPAARPASPARTSKTRSEEHTSELQSRFDLV